MEKHFVPIGTVVFTHIYNGVARHFNITELTKIVDMGLAMGVLEVIAVAIDPDFAQLCKVNRGVEQHRLDRITEDAARVPMFFTAEDSGSYLLVDGNHRYVWLAENGYKSGPAVLIPKFMWERVLIQFVDYEVTEADLLTMSSNIP